METKKLSLFWNPFQKIAGWEALGWGLLGLAATIILAILSECHFHGLLHFGFADNSAWWCYLCEHLIIWTIPSTLFCLGTWLFTQKHFRIVDVFGTTLFAQIPFVFQTLSHFIPQVQSLKNLNITDSTPHEQIVQQVMQPEFLIASFIMLFFLVFPIWVLIWMFQALKVSCNIKGKNLVINYLFSIIIGEIICRLLIRMMY